MIDVGERRNRFAGHAYGFIGRDGVPPGDIAREAREQLLSYADLEWLEATATLAFRTDDGFVVATGDEKEYSAARLVLATGVTDQLPDVPGLSERWGRAVFHCP